MAIYVTSDLHGFSIAKFKQLLKKIGFSGDDWLYILGDVIDRGEDGIAILKWLLEQPNVELIRGNHEQLLLDSLWAFGEITDESVSKVSARNIGSLDMWASNGGTPTISVIRQMLHNDPVNLEDIVDYLNDTPLCESVEVNGRSFLLCHSGFGNFSKDKKFSDYTEHDILWNRPSVNDKYFDDIITVFGHTPTEYYGCDGKALVTDTWIDIDVGVYLGHNPMFLRLDDLQEFYFDN